MKGTIRYYDFKKGSGYITSDGGTVFIIADNIFKRRYPLSFVDNEAVEFDVLSCDDTFATNIQSMAEANSYDIESL